MPAWYGQKGVIDVTPVRKKPEPEPGPAPTMYVHPVVLQLESALASDSLRTLCQVLAKAKGRITPAPDNPDRTRYPIMDASLTVRAFLRFVELRFGASDDLQPKDFVGKCGSGVRVLLRKCRDYQTEVFAALQTRVDDVVKMIRAFYDQTALIGKFQPFFRTVVEAATPAILARRREPLPRLISFLEPYGDIQLTFLYEAALSGTFTAERSDWEPSQLLETTESWMKKARSGQLAIILMNKVRALVRVVSMLDIELPPGERTEWFAAAMWASVPEMSTQMKRLEVRVREGLIERADPGELFGLATLLSVEGVETTELYELLGMLLRQAFAASGLERASKVLEDVESRPARPYPPELVKALMDICAHFAGEASPQQLERLLELWVGRSFQLQECPRSMAGVLLERAAADLPPGPAARSGGHLAGLGVEEEALAPLVERLLDEPAGWAEQRKAGPRLGVEEFSVRAALALLGGQLWPVPEAPPPRLTSAEAALRLVGPSRGAARAADAAVARLVGELARQLPGHAEQAEAAVLAWLAEASGRRLASALAPWLLAEARAGAAAPEDGGHISRSAALLSRALRAEPLGLRSAEWALGPFAGADEEDSAVALEAVAAACGADGASIPVVERAAKQWLSEESPPAGLGPLVVKAALHLWESDGTTGPGLEKLRKVYAWLSSQPDVQAQTAMGLMSSMGKAMENLTTLLNAIDGVPPSIAQLKRAREGVFSQLGLAGRAALIDAVAMAWCATLPGVTPGAASAHIQLYWQRAENSRSLVESLVIGSLEELKWQSRLRMEATFGKSLLPGMQGPPAWRVEGRNKVPWFVTEDLVKEAYSAEGDARLAERGRSPSEKGAFVRNLATVQKAKSITGGVCMFCGCSAGDLKGRLVFPLELGGLNLQSNLSAACPLCVDFLIRLGPKRWGEALLAKPEQAAEVWWQAQKKANMKTMDLLGRQGGDAAIPDLTPKS